MLKNSLGEITATSAVLAAIMQWVPPAVAIVGLVWWMMKLVIEWPAFVEAIKRIRIKK